MINLRYHIVSLTAVFLAIGIGLTLGSTFLDRATVDNLNGQLETLSQRVSERDEQIDALQGEVDRAQALQQALDEQSAGLLAGRLDPVPVLVVASEGVDEEDVDGAIRSLEVAGAEVQGLWWLSERFLLADGGDVTDLATALEESSDDPARLRRMAIAAIGDQLREQQLESADVSADGEELPVDPAQPTETAPGEVPAGGAAVDPATGEPIAGPATEAPTAQDPAGDPTDQAGGSPEDLGGVQALIDAGFVVFQPVADGPEVPTLPDGVRIVIVGGSPAVPDDVVVGPLVDRMVRDLAEPPGTVVTSALGDASDVSEVVAAVRADERLRTLLSTVDDLEHFQGWMATVLAIEDLAEDVVGHYGLGEGASSLLPPLQAP